MTVPVLSKFSISMLILILKYLAYEKMSVDNGTLLLNFLEGDDNQDGERLYSWTSGKNDKDGKPVVVNFDKENIAFVGIDVAMKALGTVDAILGNLSKLRASADWARAGCSRPGRSRPSSRS